jgi:beta-N-acetylhexosaminidase
VTAAPAGRPARRGAERATAVRRRRLALGAVACLAAVVGAIVGASGDGEDAAPPAASAKIVCPPAVAADPRRLVGQMLIVRMEGSATQQLRRRVRRGLIGGVILFPPLDTATSALRTEVRALRGAASATGAPAPLVAIDQEGGEVKRLPAAPPGRSPAELGAAGPPAARAAGRATGRGLARLGIDVDLAPVLDVPVSDAAFIGSRAFATEADRVRATGVAFGEGLEQAGVAATAKHFPGLGRATANTDLAASTVAATRAQLDDDLVPFRAAVAAGIDLVMVSNATYPAYDAARPASLSPALVAGLLRDRLGYRGVVISDDLGAGAIAGAGIDEGTAAVRAARAGADLLLLALSDGTAAARALRRALRSGRLDRRALLASCARATALRARLAA